MLTLAAEILRQIMDDVAVGLDALDICQRTAQGMSRLVSTLEVAAGSNTRGPTLERAAGDVSVALSALDAHASAPWQMPNERASRLTDREREVWQRAKAGVPYAKIASKLGITVETVYAHMRNVRKKYPVLKARSKASRA